MAKIDINQLIQESLTRTDKKEEKIEESETPDLHSKLVSAVSGETPGETPVEENALQSKLAAVVGGEEHIEEKKQEGPGGVAAVSGVTGAALGAMGTGAVAKKAMNKAVAKSEKTIASMKSAHDATKSELADLKSKGEVKAGTAIRSGLDKASNSQTGKTLKSLAGEAKDQVMNNRKVQGALGAAALGAGAYKAMKAMKNRKAATA